LGTGTTRTLLLTTLCLVLLVPGGRGLAQPDDELKALRKDVEALTQRQLAVEKELREIKALLRRAMSAREPENVVLSVKGHPSRGAGDAKLTLVEFSDYQCPFCGRYFRETLPQIEQDYVKTGRVRYVFRNFPLEAIHKEAFKAAEAADCAGEQGRYWEMHDRLFAAQQALAPAELPGHARALGLDAPRFQECLDTQKYAAAIRQDMSEAQQAGVRGTPSFFIGLTGADGSSVKALKVITGAHPYATFKEAFDSLLSAQKD
jgi:protein-disulfide isomerase